MAAPSAICEFEQVWIFAVRRKSGLTGRIAATVVLDEWRLWAEIAPCLKQAADSKALTCPASLSLPYTQPVYVQCTLDARISPLRNCGHFPPLDALKQLSYLITQAPN